MKTAALGHTWGGEAGGIEAKGFFIYLFLILAALGHRGSARDFLYLWRMGASLVAHGLSCPVAHSSQGSQLHPRDWKADAY